MKGVTLQISFLSFFFFFVPGELFVWRDACQSERAPPILLLSTPMATSLWGLNDLVHRKVSAFKELRTPTFGESTGFLYSVRKDTHMNPTGQCGNSHPYVRREEQKHYLYIPSHLPTFS